MENGIKNFKSSNAFKSQIKSWYPNQCPQRLSKIYTAQASRVRIETHILSVEIGIVYNYFLIFRDIFKFAFLFRFISLLLCHLKIQKSIQFKK